MTSLRTKFFLLLIFTALLFAAFSGVTSAPASTPGTGSSQVHGNTAPDSGTFNGCPAKGDGGDPQLNTLKNRMDTTTWVPIPFSQLEQLPWPKAIERKDMNTWSQADYNTVALNNGRPVSITGYLANARREGPE